MPVFKYRDGADIPPPPAVERGSAEHLRRLRALWSRASRLAPRRFQPGLYRYRSVEEAERAASATAARQNLTPLRRRS